MIATATTRSSSLPRDIEALLHLDATIAVMPVLLVRVGPYLMLMMGRVLLMVRVPMLVLVMLPTAMASGWPMVLMAPEGALMVVPYLP